MRTSTLFVVTFQDNYLGIEYNTTLNLDLFLDLGCHVATGPEIQLI